MAYQATLNGTQQITILNQGIQTLITSSISNPGQQQSQSSSFTTGNWQNKPQLFQTNQGYILRVYGAEKHFWLLIQPQGIQALNTMPNIETNAANTANENGQYVDEYEFHVNANGQYVSRSRQSDRSNY